jgi:hypothetical protein
MQGLTEYYFRANILPLVRDILSDRSGGVRKPVINIPSRRVKNSKLCHVHCASSQSRRPRMTSHAVEGVMTA